MANPYSAETLVLKKPVETQEILGEAIVLVMHFIENNRISVKRALEGKYKRGSRRHHRIFCLLGGMESAFRSLSPEQLMVVKNRLYKLDHNLLECREKVREEVLFYLTP
jgi:hypothetical protein